MAGFEVDTGTLDLVRQLAERQAGHLRAIRDHLNQHTSLDGVGGVVMACLRPRYDEGRRTALDGFDQGVTVSEAVATRAAETRTAYLDADRSAVDRFRMTAADLGITLRPFDEPDPPTLRTGTDVAADGAWSLDEGVHPWDRGTPSDLRPAVDGARTLATTTVRRTNPVPSSPLSSFALRYPADQVMTWAIGRAWDVADRTLGIPTANSSLREQYELRQSTQYSSAYDAGARASGEPTLAYGSEWSQSRTSERTVQGAAQVYATVAQFRSAWNALEGAQDAATRRDAVLDVGSGEADTSAIDWAR